MAKQTINVGTTANDRKGDSLRAAFQKVNANFTELYTVLGLDIAPLNLGAFEFNGSTISTTDSSSITLDQATTIASNLTVGGDILPETANGGNLGSAAKPWKSLYVSSNTIYIGSTALGINNSGDLTLNGSSFSPDYSTIQNAPTDISDLTDNQGLLAGGTANTGDVTFDGIKVIGAGTASGDGAGYSTLEFVPDNNLYNNDQYLVVDPTAPSHIHIRAGGTQDASNAELFLGGEKNHVKVNDYAGVRLQNERLVENFYYYSDPTFTSGSWYEENGSFYVEFTTTDPIMVNNFWEFTNGGQNRLTLNQNATEEYGGFGSNPSPNVYKVQVLSGPVTSPETLNSIEFQLFTTQTNNIILENSDFRVDVYDDIRMFGRDIFRLANYSVDTPIEIITNYDANSHTWAFEPNGDLTLPNNAVIRVDGSNVEVGNVTNFNVEALGVVNIYTDTNGITPHQWQFGDAGEFILPNDGIVTAGGSGGLTIGANFDVKIVADYTDNNHTWTFRGSDSTLKLPVNGSIEGGSTISVGTQSIFSADYFGSYTNSGASGISLPITVDSQAIQTGWTATFTTGGTYTVQAVSTIGDRLFFSMNDGGGFTADLPVAFTSPDYVPATESPVTVTSNNKDWVFGTDGTLTFPGGMTVETDYGGSARLVIDGKGNFVDIRDSGVILVGYNSTGNVQIGNPEGGTTTEIVSEQVRFLLQAVPTSSVGAAGDSAGLIAFDQSYIYYCTGLYDGITNIWKRVAWSGDTW